MNRQHRLLKRPKNIAGQQSLAFPFRVETDVRSGTLHAPELLTVHDNFFLVEVGRAMSDEVKLLIPAGAFAEPR